MLVGAINIGRRRAILDIVAGPNGPTLLITRQNIFGQAARSASKPDRRHPRGQLRHGSQQRASKKPTYLPTSRQGNWPVFWT